MPRLAFSSADAPAAKNFAGVLIFLPSARVARSITTAASSWPISLANEPSVTGVESPHRVASRSATAAAAAAPGTPSTPASGSSAVSSGIAGSRVGRAGPTGAGKTASKAGFMARISASAQAGISRGPSSPRRSSATRPSPPTRRSSTPSSSRSRFRKAVAAAQLAVSGVLPVPVGGAVASRRVALIPSHTRTPAPAPTRPPAPPCGNASRSVACINPSRGLLGGDCGSGALVARLWRASGAPDLLPVFTRCTWIPCRPAAGFSSIKPIAWSTGKAR
jgi:hypothetical protein